MARIQLRRDTSTNWSTNNPTPLAGEPCFETDTGKLKIGDGSTAYNDLAYQGGGGSSDVPENMLTTDTDQTITSNKTISNTNKLIFDKINASSEYKQTSLVKGEKFENVMGYSNFIYANSGTRTGAGIGSIQQGSAIVFPTEVTSQALANRIYSKGSSNACNLNIISDTIGFAYVLIKGYNTQIQTGPRGIQLEPDLTSSSGKVTVKHSVNDSTSSSAVTYYAENTDASSIKRHIVAGDNITIEQLKGSSGEDTGIKISASGSGSGSGDVTSSGNNTFTGLNTFNEPIQVKSSSNSISIQQDNQEIGSTAKPAYYDCLTLQSSTGDICLNPIANLDLENSSGEMFSREGRIVNGTTNEIIPSINDTDTSTSKTWSAYKLSTLTTAEQAANAAMPKNSVETTSFTVGASRAKYVAPANGYVVARCRFTLNSTEGNVVELYTRTPSDDVSMVNAEKSSQAGILETFMPVSKGTTFYYMYDGTINTTSPLNTLFLVPCIGG